MDKVPKTIVLVSFYHILLSPLDFLTHEDGTDRLSRNVGAELPLHAA